jgi:hypothetical protein
MKDSNRYKGSEQYDERQWLNRKQTKTETGVSDRDESSRTTRPIGIPAGDTGKEN